MCVCVTVGVRFVSGIFGTKSHQKYPTHGLALKGGSFCEVICGILWAFWSWALMLGLGHSFMDFFGLKGNDWLQNWWVHLGGSNSMGRGKGNKRIEYVNIYIYIYMGTTYLLWYSWIIWLLYTLVLSQTQKCNLRVTVHWRHVLPAFANLHLWGWKTALRCYALNVG